MSDLIMLNDPELARPSDPIPGPFLAIGASVGGFVQFPTVSAMIACRDAIEADLARQVQPWQAAIVPPAWVIVLHDDLTIYGQLHDDAAITRLELEAGASEASVPDVLARVDEAAQRGWLYGRWYSRIEPAGEPGTWHRSAVRAVITDEMAARARQAGWAAL